MTFNHYDIGSNPVNSSLTILSIILVEYNNLITDVLELVDKPILGIGGRDIV
jgi:hypothetical protein